MSRKYKDILLFGITGVLIGSIMAISGILITDIFFKWIVVVLSVLILVASLGTVVIAIIANRSYLKDEGGELADVLKTSFQRKLLKDGYRQEILNRIVNNINSKNTVSFSHQTINFLIIDLRKAKKKLSKSDFKKIRNLYLINTLKKENKQLDEIDRLNFKRVTEYERNIESIEEFYNIIIDVTKPYLQICSINYITTFLADEFEFIEKIIKQNNNKFDEIANVIYKEIFGTVNYSLSEIKQKIEKCPMDELIFYLNEILDMKKKNYQVTRYLIDNPLNILLDDARLGKITIDNFKEKGLIYLLSKRQQEDTNLKEIQNKINFFIKWMEHDSDSVLIYGNPYPNGHPKDKWHRYVTETIMTLSTTEETFENKIEILYQLTKHIYNLFQTHPLCEIEQKDNHKIKEIIKTVFEEEYIKLSSSRIKDYSNAPNFALIPEMPMYTRGELGLNAYLKRLTTSLDEKLSWKKQGSMSVDGINGMIDIYEGYLPSGKRYKTLYVNMCGTANSITAPKGFKFI